MDPDLRRIIFGTDTLPFSITIVFPVFEGADYDRARGAGEGVTQLS